MSAFLPAVPPGSLSFADGPRVFGGNDGMKTTLKGDVATFLSEHGSLPRSLVWIL